MGYAATVSHSQSYSWSHARWRHSTTRATQTRFNCSNLLLTQSCFIERAHQFQLPQGKVHYDVLQAPEPQRFPPEAWALAWQRDWWGTYMKLISVAYVTLGVIWAAALSFGKAVDWCKQIKRGSHHDEGIVRRQPHLDD